MKRVGRGSSTWADEPFERVLTLFSSSPLVRKPAASFASFTVSTIPEHQRYEHINETHNWPDSGDAGLAFGFAFGRRWPGTPDPGC
jgi:hypothetical protein